MEFIIDTVNLEDIKEAVEYMPIVGVTSNPSIVKKTSPKDFFKHMKEIRKIKTGIFGDCGNGRWNLCAIFVRYYV